LADAALKFSDAMRSNNCSEVSSDEGASGEEAAGQPN